MKMDPQKEPRFEDTYPKAPFSELIRLTIFLAAMLHKLASTRWSRASSDLTSTERFQPDR